MEKRHFHRVTFTAPVLLKQADNQWQTDVLDLSLKGALIGYPDEFEADLEGTFELEIPILGSKQNIQLNGVIVHSANHCLGFQVNDVDLESITQLRRLIELNLGDDSKLHHDLKALVQN